MAFSFVYSIKENDVDVLGKKKFSWTASLLRKSKKYQSWKQAPSGFWNLA